MRVIVVVGGLLLAPGVLRAQTMSGWQLDAWVGAGPSVVAGSWGGVPGRRLLLGTVSWARPLLRSRTIALSYHGEVMPVAVLTGVPHHFEGWFYNVAHTESVFVSMPTDPGPVLGAGLMPVSLRISAALGSRTAAFLDAGAGGVVFTRAVPEPDARRLNVLAVAGAGVRISRWVVGYRFVHVSNANTAPSNPGLNVHLVYVGRALTWR